MNTNERAKHSWNMFKNSVDLFIKHDTFTMGAALAFYTVFSLGPVLIIGLSVAGSMLGHDAVMGEVKDELKGFLGTQGAEQVQDIIRGAYKPGKNWIATTIALVVLLIGATSVFSQLRSSLNIIWDVKPTAKMPVWRFLLDRIFSFAMIICLAFLLLVAFLIHAGMTGFTDYLNRVMPHTDIWILKMIQVILSFSITTVLFALTYKYMSDAKLQWNRVWIGALFTAFLFTIGKHLIGLYIGSADLGNTYGASGTVLIVLVWVFY
jgi:membrane protein